MSIRSRVLTGAAVLVALAASGAAQAYTNPPFTAPGIANPGYPAFVSGVTTANLYSIGFQWNANADGHHDGAYVLSINEKTQNAGAFNFQSGAYLIGNENIQLTANFSKTGQLLTGGYWSNTYEVEGSVAASKNPSYGTAPSGFSWNAQPNELLFSESLTGFGVDLTHDALGFSTSNFGGWANQKQFTSGGPESLWLYALISTGNLYCVAPRTNNNCNNAPLQNGTFPYVTTNSAWNNFLKQLSTHSGLTSATFNGIGEIATVPVPPSVWLLGSGLLGLFGVRRRKLVPADKVVGALAV